MGWGAGIDIQKHLSKTRRVNMRTLTLKKYNYRGPRTKLEYGLNWNDPNITDPINNLDAICQMHDITYSKAQSLKDTHIADYIDCKTVRIFAYSSTREQSNKRSRTRLKTETETGERRFSLSPHTPVGRVRLACFARVRLSRHALPISLLILRKKPTVLQSTDYTMLDETSKRSYKDY